MKIFILQYKGTSFISKLIKAVTWSKYSHTAIAHGGTGWCVEAWEKGGITMAASPWENHKPNTEIDVYSFKPDWIYQNRQIWKAALAMTEYKYDFISLLGFLPILRHFWKDDPKKFFCSHLVAQVCSAGDSPLFSEQTPLYKISPGLVPWSPRLKYAATVTNNEEWDQFLERVK